MGCAVMNACRTVSCVLSLLVLVACSDAKKEPAKQGTDASVSTDAGTGRDAQASTQPRDTARALATIEPTIAAERGETTPISLFGQGALWEHGQSVTLRLDIQGCKPGTLYQARIQAGSDCSDKTLTGAVWSGGDGIDTLRCPGTGAAIRKHYARQAEYDKPWTIGGSRETNVVGHALVLFEVESGQHVSCGVIERAPDAPPSETTDSEGPSLQVRGALAGVCIFDRLVGNKVTPDCPDYATAVACATTRCELNRCLDTCATSVKCLAQARGLDVCMAAFTCEPTDACGQCQSDVLRCEVDVCLDKLSCSGPARQDGACSQLLKCCMRDNENPASCLDFAEQLMRFSGEAECQRLIDDWNVRGDRNMPCEVE